VIKCRVTILTRILVFKFVATYIYFKGAQRCIRMYESNYLCPLFVTEIDIIL